MLSNRRSNRASTQLISGVIVALRPLYRR